MDCFMTYKTTYKADLPLWSGTISVEMTQENLYFSRKKNSISQESMKKFLLHLTFFFFFENLYFVKIVR